MKRLTTCLEELQRWLLSGKTYLKGVQCTHAGSHQFPAASTQLVNKPAEFILEQSFQLKYEVQLILSVILAGQLC